MNVTYSKKGQVSAKPHATKATGKEHYLDRYSPVPQMCKYGAPGHFTRKMLNIYGKTTKAAPEANDMDDGY